MAEQEKNKKEFTVTVEKSYVKDYTVYAEDDSEALEIVEKQLKNGEIEFRYPTLSSVQISTPKTEWIEVYDTKELEEKKEDSEISGIDAIEQLEDLVRDRESFVTGDKFHDDIFQKDNEALKFAIRKLKDLV